MTKYGIGDSPTKCLNEWDTKGNADEQSIMQVRQMMKPEESLRKTL